MLTESANFPSKRARRVVHLLYPGFAVFDVAGPAQAFGAVGRDLYRQELVSLDGGLVESDAAGIAMQTKALCSDAMPIDTLMIPGGEGFDVARRDARLIALIGPLATRARRVASVCVGAFLLAEAGLLEGRRAATHWRACDVFRSLYPGTALDANAIFVQDGPIWSSAGISAGVDLTLALIEADLGHGEAMRVARELVVYLRRSGGQSQFSTVLAAQSRSSHRFADLLAWVSDHLDEDLSIPALAARCGMSERSFIRHFYVATGHTPAKAIEKLRVEAACSLLQDGLPMSRALSACGFSDEQRMRRAFVRQLKITPAQWCDRFAATLG